MNLQLKKGIILSFIASLLLCACSPPVQLFQAANETIPDADAADPSPAVTDAIEIVPEGRLITFRDYAWGEDFARILSEKTSVDMQLGTDYGYYENIGPFSKELVFTEEYAELPFRTYYDFDNGDRLVSVMLVLHQNLPTAETVSLYLSIVEEFSRVYGPCVSAENVFDPDGNYSLEDYSSEIEAGRNQSLFVWTDSIGTQLLTECRLNSGTDMLELIILFNTSEYVV